MNQYNRPLAPHLYSYKPQITSLFSIFHRISGFFLSFCLFLSSFYFIFVSSFISFRIFFIVIYLFIMLFIYLYFVLLITVFFHFVNGIRHLFWDFCLGLELKNIFFTGYCILFLVIFSIILFIIF